MARTTQRRIAALTALLAAGLLAGCEKPLAGDGQTPAEAAREALDIEAPGGTDRTVETQKKVDVIQETTVINRETGEVISAEKEITPVTVTKEKEVETDVDVNVGKTVKDVE